MFGANHTHTHYHFPSDNKAIRKLLKQILMNQTELAAQLAALTEQTKKSFGEINGKLAELDAAIAAQGNVSPEVQAALEELKAAVQSNDDLIPDAQLPSEEPTQEG
jgi:methyl-accepting chemotaxis protein